MFLRVLAPDQRSKNTCLNLAADNWAEIHANLRVRACWYCCLPLQPCRAVCDLSCSLQWELLEPCSAVVAHSYSEADNLNTFFFRKIFVSLLASVQRKKGEPLKAALCVPSTAPFYPSEMYHGNCQCGSRSAGDLLRTGKVCENSSMPKGTKFKTYI